MKKQIIVVVCVSLAAAEFVAGAADVPMKNERQPEQTNIDGYSNTPMQPDGKWHIHDPKRTQPPVAEPKYDGKRVPPPNGSKVLFDGSNLDQFANKGWKLEDGAMIATKGGQKSKEKFGDVHLHLEWMVPVGLKGYGQKQGNSGVYLMERYEIQVLNCWANRTYPDGMTGALYGQQPPMVNACRKPGEWQSYDIHFKAPVFKDGKLISAAYVTVYLNNVLIQDNVAFNGATAWKRLPRYKPHEPTGHFNLQQHGSPVRYRNIWVAPLKLKLGE